MSWTNVAQGAAFNNRRKRKTSLEGYGGGNGWSGTVNNLNMIQQVYRGRYDRLERYRQYDWMDQDTDISRALDLIAEHCTEQNSDGDFFEFKWKTEEPTEELSLVLKENLQQWSKTNEWYKRLWRNVRNVLKYGDWFYFRNPDTFELYNIHPKHVLGALVDRETNEIIAWIVNNFKFNIENLEITIDSKGLQNSINPMGQNTDGARNTKVIPAIHIIHLTMSEGRFAGATSDDNPEDSYANRWPFGESWLEKSYKTFKQRELLEDAAVIHRVQRAPTRNVWYIDTGKARADRASWTVSNFKNEMNQKRIPQFIGSSQKSVDSVYNPISQLEDYYIPVSMDQRGSKVESLEGTPWTDLPDLDYFKKKMMSALRVPYAWLMGPQEGGSIFNDGRSGVAYQEEIEFSRFCSRTQNNIIGSYDMEFKLYCKVRDVNINAADFELGFIPPDNYEESKRLSRQQEAIGVWGQIKDEPYISYRFALKEFLGLSEDKILENEQMLLEENDPMESDLAGDPGFAGGGVGGFMGGPMGGGMMGGDLGGPGMDSGLGDLGGAEGGDLGGADMGAAGGDAGGGFLGGGGFGESAMIEDKRKLTEEEIGLDDIQPADRKYQDDERSRTPDDKIVMGDDAIKGRPVATLSMLSKIRRSHMAQRVNQMKRLKLLQKVYNKPSDGGGGMGI